MSLPIKCNDNGWIVETCAAKGGTKGRDAVGIDPSPAMMMLNHECKKWTNDHCKIALRCALCKHMLSQSICLVEEKTTPFQAN